MSETIERRSFLSLACIAPLIPAAAVSAYSYRWPSMQDAIAQAFRYRNRYRRSDLRVKYFANLRDTQRPKVIEVTVGEWNKRETWTARERDMLREEYEQLKPVMKRYPVGTLVAGMRIRGYLRGRGLERWTVSITRADGTESGAPTSERS